MALPTEAVNKRVMLVSSYIRSVPLGDRERFRTVRLFGWNVFGVALGRVCLKSPLLNGWLSWSKVALKSS